MEITQLTQLSSLPAEFYIGLGIFLVIITILKGCAMYRAARKESKGWFWVLLITNTLGILPLLYLIFSKKAGEETE